MNFLFLCKTFWKISFKVWRIIVILYKILIIIFNNMRKNVIYLAMTLCVMTAHTHAQGLRLNQLGYFSNQEKVIVLDNVQPKGSVVVYDEKGKKVKSVRAKGSVQSPWSGKTRYLFNLSALTQPGDYRIKYNGETVNMHVGDQVLRGISIASLKALYMMRSGVAIDERYAGRYARELGHPDTEVYIHPSAESEGRPAGSVISSPLGWYDAGDYNKYITNSAFTIGLLLSVYEQIPEYFEKLNTNIPESGNTTPDILDEMMFNLKWMLTMQDPADGGVYHKLTTPSFEGFVMPRDCHQKRYVVAKSVTATYDFAAVMAQAARLLKDNADYPEFSTQATAAAQKAYEWAVAHPEAFYSQRIMNSQYEPMVFTGEYGDENSDDERFWAATELYLLTQAPQYKIDAAKYIPSAWETPVWGQVSALGSLAWLDTRDNFMYEPLIRQLKEYSDTLVARVNGSCFYAPFGNVKSDFGWGSLAEHCCAPGIILLYADRHIKKDAYAKYALENANYLLGRNPLGYCYVTGWGTKSPLHPHQRLSAADGIEAPMPGLLVGGPNPGQQDKNDMKDQYQSSLPDESYLDVEGSYASNEIAINWNASLAGLLCWLDAIYGR